MKWKHNKEEPEDKLKEYKELMSRNFTSVITCCECDIFIEIVQTYDFKYETRCYSKNICDFHKKQALDKYTEKVRSKLI